MPLSESHHCELRPLAVAAVDSFKDFILIGAAEAVNLSQEIRHTPASGSTPSVSSLSPYCLKSLSKNMEKNMPENNRIGYLHHCCLKVYREKNILLFWHRKPLP